MKNLTTVLRPWMVLCFLGLAIAPSVAKAQCIAHPTRQTTISVMNASIYSIAFYIDGVKRVDVLPGERSIDLIVRAGQHALLAETTIGGEDVSATRTFIIPGGSMCVWSVTNPANPLAKTKTIFSDALARQAIIPLVGLY